MKEMHEDRPARTSPATIGRAAERAGPPRRPTRPISATSPGRFEFAGAHIRNIVLAAANLAAAEGPLIAQRHVLHAAHHEYQKLGRIERQDGIRMMI
jgi:hypothetical protein